jgi:L-seryl-tRNA(Ser) seleniumtransferase
MPREMVMRHRLPQFGHLFSSDSYSAGYYSYLWSEVMDADTWEMFEATRGLKNQIIVARSQRNMYDHAVRAAGARLVEVGLPDRVAGAGIRDAEPWEYAGAITDRTAAIYYVATPDSEPALSAVVEVARAHGVPVIVDAAAQLPPLANLKRFIAEGADLVVFSGGKAIGGPQASGMLAGRRDLVMSAALQHLDMDVDPATWSPPGDLIDRALITGLPHHGIGRACKVGKEEIAGLVTALGLTLAEAADGSRQARWQCLADELAGALNDLDPTTAEVAPDPARAHVPSVHQTDGADAAGIAQALTRGAPAKHSKTPRHGQGVLVLGVMCLADDDPARIAAGVRHTLRP